MEHLIPVINKLQDVFSAVGGQQIDLPQIVVVGAQSSGKSSVLEAVVGKDFLPRGSNIVTRRPLILQLVHVSDQGHPEFGEFLHKPNQKYTDFLEIRKEIDAETNRTCRGISVSSVPIRLRVYSPHVLDLTLVDLPGLTKIAASGQDQTIVTEIREMAVKYASQPNAIILAVHAANSDLANSDGLQLAREIDPEGARTLGVLTKIDIMDRGTDALDMLMGRVIPLRLGYIGVVNRSQADIQSNKSIRDALKDEEKYFSEHPVYRSIANRMGTNFLTKVLNKLLMDHIRDNLPELKMKISHLLQETQNELNAYGDSFYDSRSKGAQLLHVISKFVNEYCNAIDGKIADSKLSVNELYGGARINYVFVEVFAKCLERIDPQDGLSLDIVRNAIKNVTGTKESLFVPEEAFEELVVNQIKRLEDPSLQCVELIHEELQRIIAQLESKELQRFQVLRARVMEVVNNLLHSCKMPTRKMISNILAIQQAHINTSHENFIGGTGAIYKAFEQMAMRQEPPMQQSGFGAQSGFGSNPGFGQQSGFGKPAGSAFGSQPAFGSPGFGERLSRPPMSLKAQMSEMTEKEKMSSDVIMQLICSYFDIVKTNVGDMVPKTIMHFLVNASKEAIQNELVRELYKEDLFDELLSEAPHIAQRRKNCMEMLTALKRANDVLSDVRDYNFNV